MKKRAEFEVVTRPSKYDRPMYPTKVTVCKTCGWETSAKDSSLYGQDGALTMAMLSHRIAHLEGRV